MNGADIETRYAVFLREAVLKIREGVSLLI